jgi:hypothetical protein
MSQAAEKWEAGEAFALMWYACECGHRERIWNARAGVTPFCMGCPSCGEASLRHVDFRRDVRAENHKPHYGQRLWIDLTIERAREYATKRIDSAPPEYATPPEERDETIEAVAQHEYAAFGAGTSPDGAVFGVRSIESVPSEGRE